MRAIFQLQTPGELVQSWETLLENYDSELTIEKKIAGPQGIIEWALPAMLVLVIAPSATFFFQGFFSRLGERTADGFVGSFESMFARNCKVERGWYSSEHLRQSTAERGKSKPAKSPPLAIRVQLPSPAGDYLPFIPSLEFIATDDLDAFGVETAFDRADEILRQSRFAFAEMNLDVVSIRNNPLRYLGVDKPDIVSNLINLYVQKRCSGFTGKFLFDIPLKRWVKLGYEG